MKGKSWIDRLEAELDPRPFSGMSYEELVEKSRALLAAMTPLQRATMYEAQRLDFAYGNVKLHNPMLTREMISDAADKADLVIRSDT